MLVKLPCPGQMGQVYSIGYASTAFRIFVHRVIGKTLDES